jgi:hypothetical protein
MFLSSRQRRELVLTKQVSNCIKLISKSSFLLRRDDKLQKSLSFISKNSITFAIPKQMGTTGIDSLCGSVVSTSGVGLDLP